MNKIIKTGFVFSSMMITLGTVAINLTACQSVFVVMRTELYDGRYPDPSTQIPVNSLMVEATNTKFILTNYKFEWSAVPSSVTPISYPYEGLEWRYIFPTCEQAYSVKVTASFVYEHKEIKNSINVHVPIHYDGCRVNSSYAV